MAWASTPRINDIYYFATCQLPLPHLIVILVLSSPFHWVSETELGHQGRCSRARVFSSAFRAAPFEFESYNSCFFLVNFEDFYFNINVFVFTQLFLFPFPFPFLLCRYGGLLVFVFPKFVCSSVVCFFA